MVSYTPIARAIQIVPLDPTYRNQWGSASAVDAWPVVLEQLAAGITAVPLGGLTSKILSVANNAPDQSRANQINFNGALTGNCTVTIPGIARTGYAMNNTTGGHNVILTTGAGSALTLTPGLLYRYRCDGTNVVADALAGNAQTATTATNLNGGSVNATSGNFSNGLNVNGGPAAVFSSTSSGSASGMAFDTRSTSGTVTGIGAVAYCLAANNNIFCNGSFFANSDARTKSGVEEISEQDAIAWVVAGLPVTYAKDGQRHAGFLAQDDVRNGRGLAVGFVADDGPLFEVGDGVAPPGVRLVRDYDTDIAFLTRCLQVALARIAALEAR